jgi:hypothetical protein
VITGVIIVAALIAVLVTPSWIRTVLDPQLRRVTGVSNGFCFRGGLKADE